MQTPVLPTLASCQAQNAPSARAVTLVELVVVLVLACMVAGLAAVTGTRLLRRSAWVASAAIASEVAAAVARHQVRTGSFPDGYDSLIEAPYTLFGAIPLAARRQLKPKDLDNADRVILAAHGVTTTWMHLPAESPGVSWQELSQRKALDVSAGGFLSDDVAALDVRRIDPGTLLGRGVARGTPNESFVVLGIGPRCSLVGPLGELQEAPVLAAGSRAVDPSRHYRRLALVLRLDRDDQRPLQFMGVVAFGESGIEAVQDMVRGALRP